MGKKKRTFSGAGMKLKDVMVTLRHIASRKGGKYRTIDISNVNDETATVPDDFYDCLADIASVRDFTVIGLKYAEGDKILRGLGGNRKLQTLWLTGVTPVTRTGLNLLSPNVSRLTLPIDEEMGSSKFSSLQALTLYLSDEVELTDRSAATMTRISELRIDGGHITPAWIKALGRSCRLQSLELHTTDLSRCPTLLADIAEIISLERLVLGDVPKQFGADVKRLIGLKSLQFAGVTDIDQLEVLSELSSLRNLSICMEHEEEDKRKLKKLVRALRAQLPRCHVVCSWF